MCKCPFVTTNKHQVIAVSSLRNGNKWDNNTSVWSAFYPRKLTVAYSILILIYGIYPRMDLLGWKWLYLTRATIVKNVVCILGPLTVAFFTGERLVIDLEHKVCISLLSKVIL